MSKYDIQKDVGLIIVSLEKFGILHLWKEYELTPMTVYARFIDKNKQFCTIYLAVYDDSTNNAKKAELKDTITTLIANILVKLGYVHSHQNASDKRTLMIGMSKDNYKFTSSHKMLNDMARIDHIIRESLFQLELIES